MRYLTHCTVNNHAILFNSLFFFCVLFSYLILRNVLRENVNGGRSGSLSVRSVLQNAICGKSAVHRKWGRELVIIIVNVVNCRRRTRTGDGRWYRTCTPCHTTCRRRHRNRPSTPEFEMDPGERAVKVLCPCCFDCYLNLIRSQLVL